MCALKASWYLDEWKLMEWTRLSPALFSWCWKRAQWIQHVWCWDLLAVGPASREPMINEWLHLWESLKVGWMHVLILFLPEIREEDPEGKYVCWLSPLYNWENWPGPCEWAWIWLQSWEARHTFTSLWNVLLLLNHRNWTQKILMYRMPAYYSVMISYTLPVSAQSVHCSENSLLRITVHRNLCSHSNFICWTQMRIKEKKALMFGIPWGQLDLQNHSGGPGPVSSQTSISRECCNAGRPGGTVQSHS